MEFFVQEGRFWLPRQRDRLVHGSVSFQENGVVLDLATSLREPVRRPGGGTGGSAAFATEPFVHGYLRDGREVTLYQARGMSWPVEDVRETWQAEYLFMGGLVSDFRFTHVQVVFDYLLPWTQPAGIAAGGVTDHEEVVIDTRRATVDHAILADKSTVRLCTGVEGRWDHASAHLDQWSALEISGPARNARSIEAVLNDWVRPLQDLLVVSLGRPVRIDHLAVRPRRQSTQPLLQVACQLVQPGLAVPAKITDIASYAAPTLVTYRDSPVPFKELIPAWFGLCERLPDVITDLCGPYYAPFIYSGHRYASTFQSAEALAHGLFDTRQKSRQDHRDRVDAVAKALEAAGLDTDNLKWATGVLLTRNDKPLREFITELVAGTGEIGQRLIRVAPDLAQEAATARSGVSHPGAASPGRFRRYWLGEALVWVVRAHVLAQLGIPMEDLSQKAIKMASFNEVLSGLKAGDTSLRAASAPSYHHGTCPVHHRTQAAAARCRNQWRDD